MRLALHSRRHPRSWQLLRGHGGLAGIEHAEQSARAMVLRTGLAGALCELEDGEGLGGFVEEAQVPRPSQPRSS